MAKTSINFAESAVADSEDIIRYHEEQSVPQVGTRLVGEVISAIELLADQPDLGRIVPEFNQQFLRELIRPPFRIVYRREKSKVSIVRIWRSERLIKLP